MPKLTLYWSHGQVRNGHEEITQQDLIAVLDKQLFEGMGMSLTDDEQLRTQATVSDTKLLLYLYKKIVLANL